MAGFKFSMKQLGHHGKKNKNSAPESVPNPGGFNSSYNNDAGVNSQRDVGPVPGPFRSVSGNSMGSGHSVPNQQSFARNVSGSHMDNVGAGVQQAARQNIGNSMHITGFSASSTSNPHEMKQRNVSNLQQSNPHTRRILPSEPDYTPWGRIRLSNSPFPRYRHVSSSHITDQGKIYVIGGLHDQSVYGDTWILTASDIDKTGAINSFKSTTIEITESTPPPRVGHASTLCGNAFVVFGGDTHKVNSDGLMDDDLYLLNINSYKWTIPKPVGQRPLGRYGHKIVTISAEQTKLYLFGGQFDDTYFGDLAVFDLSSFRRPDSHWVFLKPSGFNPPPLTNHTMVTYQDKIWVFGGDTLEEGLINRVYLYSPTNNSWEIVETTGDIPPPMQEHAAIVYKDLMCVVGGKDAEDNYLNTVYFLNLQSLKWFKLPFYKNNIPQGRSGHSVTLLKNDQILIMGGDKYDYSSSTENMHISDVDMGKGTILYTLNLADVGTVCPGIFDNTRPVTRSPTTPKFSNKGEDATSPNIMVGKPPGLHQEPQILTPAQEQMQTPKQQIVMDMDKTPKDYVEKEPEAAHVEGQAFGKGTIGTVISENRKPSSPVPQLIESSEDGVKRTPTIASAKQLSSGPPQQKTPEKRMISDESSSKFSELDQDDSIDDEVGVAHIATSPAKNGFKMTSTENTITAAMESSSPDVLLPEIKKHMSEGTEAKTVTHSSDMDDQTTMISSRHNVAEDRQSPPQLKEAVDMKIDSPTLEDTSANLERAQVEKFPEVVARQVGAVVPNLVPNHSTGMASNSVLGMKKENNMSREHFENLRDELSKIKQAALEKANAADNHIRELESELNKLRAEQQKQKEDNKKMEDEISQFRKRYDLLDADYKEMEDTLQQYEDILAAKVLDAEKFNGIIKVQSDKIDELKLHVVNSEEFEKLKIQNEVLEKENQDLKDKLKEKDNNLDKSIVMFSGTVDELLKNWRMTSKKDTSSASPVAATQSQSTKNRNIISKMNNRLDDLLVKSKELTESEEQIDSEYEQLEIKNESIQSQARHSSISVKETASDIANAMNESKRKIEDYKAHTEKLQNEIDGLKGKVNHTDGEISLDKQSEEKLREEIEKITAEKEELNRQMQGLKMKIQSSSDNLAIL